MQRVLTNYFGLGINLWLSDVSLTLNWRLFVDAVDSHKQARKLTKINLLTENDISKLLKKYEFISRPT